MAHRRECHPLARRRADEPVIGSHLLVRKYLMACLNICGDCYRDHAEGVARGEDGEGPALDLARGGEAGRLVRTLVRHHLTHTDRVNIMKLLFIQRSKYGFIFYSSQSTGWLVIGSVFIQSTCPTFQDTPLAFAWKNVKRDIDCSIDKFLL